MKIPTEDRPRIVRAYVDFLIPMKQLADEFGVESQTIGKLLREEGVKPKDHSFVALQCGYCLGDIQVPRYKVRHSNLTYCGVECKERHAAEPQYKAEIEATRKTRRHVRKFFPLEDRHVVLTTPRGHYVFHNHADRRRWEATGEGEPLWSG
jgi:hypothetical protein